MPHAAIKDIEDIKDADIKDIICSYLDTYGSSRYQRESYDQFVTTTVGQIVQENSNMVIQHPEGQLVSTFSFCNVRMSRPCIVESNGFSRDITPAEARLRSMTYSSGLYVDLIQRTENTATREVVDEKHFIGKQIADIPAMVGSSLCNKCIEDVRDPECVHDQGGYFIVNGVEKGFVSQEKLRINYPFVFKARHDNKNAIVCEIRSCHEKKLRSTSTLYITALARRNAAVTSIAVQIPFVPSPLQLMDMFCMLGVSSVEDVRSMLLHDDDSAELRALISGFLHQAPEASSYQQLLSRIDVQKWKKPGQGSFSHENHILTNEVLPHIGLDGSAETRSRKAWFLAFSVRKMFRVIRGEVAFDDRDHYANKRVDTAGSLMSLLFRQLFRAFIKYCNSQLTRYIAKPRVGNIMSFISPKKITSGFRYAFATGNWGIQKNASTQTGVLQVLNRMTLVSPISNLQRINTPLCREGKAPEPRQLHASSWGVVCAAETPEGASCGLMKNLCVLAGIRNGVETDVVWPSMRNISVLRTGLPSSESSIPVFINGQCLAHVEPPDGDELVRALISLRRCAAIPPDSSVAWDTSSRCVCVCTDRGALFRPVFVVENLHLLADALRRFSGVTRKLIWTELIGLGIIEYMSKDEEAMHNIATDLSSMDPSIHSHVEIHPTVISGTCAAQIPFSDHNQAPRNCYQSAMGKQAIGIYATNYSRRMDNVAHVLVQPQRPMVSTWTDEAMHTTSLPSGANAVVAIMCWTGYNQEDSVIINKTALDNGMLETVLYRSYREDTTPNASDVENIECPDTNTCTNMKTSNYDCLNGKAVVEVGTSLRAGDVIIGKTISSRECKNGSSKSKKRDNSTCIKQNEDAVVDMIFHTENCDQKIVKVRTRQVRKPHIGDKVASRHGQKGVVGIIYNEKDMPFTADGIRPDIIVNPHAIPSRMTIGMLVEMLLGRECATSGNLGDGTPFRGTSVQHIADELERHGVSRYSTDTMYNAYTGEKLQSAVFMAPVYYQRLRHMVIDKIHSRGRGPVQLLTRQPNEGRSREGGLRFGEMERDCILAYGCASSLREYLFEKSDPYMTVACRKCGVLCEPYHDQKRLAHGEKRPVGYCRGCDSVEHTTHLRIPYAMKLLLQELQALHINVKFRFDALECEDGGLQATKIEQVFDFVM